MRKSSTSFNRKLLYGASVSEGGCFATPLFVAIAASNTAGGRYHDHIDDDTQQPEEQGQNTSVRNTRSVYTGHQNGRSSVFRYDIHGAVMAG